MNVRRIAIVTGTRAEYGLLRSVMHAVDRHPQLTLEVLVTGIHLLPDRNGIDEIAGEFDIAATIPMQIPDESGRSADAAAIGRGVSGFAARFAAEKPDVVVVLGDRIEAFAAAGAAAVSGIHVAHMHGGDRAQGIADESLRHAITKLAHIHLPATEASAKRIELLGENPERIHVVGSPAIDDLDDFAPVSDAQYESLGSPRFVVLLHPLGRSIAAEREIAERVLQACSETGATLAMHPNNDTGFEGIVQAIESRGGTNRRHLPRGEFVGLLRRVDAIVGNSSAGLIEAAAVGVRSVNIGERQAGREKPANVIDIAEDGLKEKLAQYLRQARTSPLVRAPHPYGDGRAGKRAAGVLAAVDLHQIGVTKKNTF